MAQEKIDNQQIQGQVQEAQEHADHELVDLRKVTRAQKERLSKVEEEVLICFSIYFFGNV